MGTKWKKWTSRPIVKILATLLCVLGVFFGATNCIKLIIFEENIPYIPYHLIDAVQQNNPTIYANNIIENEIYYAHTIAQLKSEKAIKSKDNLILDTNNGTIYSTLTDKYIHLENDSYDMYEINDDVVVTEYGPIYTEQQYKQAIREEEQYQMSELKMALEQLEHSGLSYSIVWDDGTQIGNTKKVVSNYMYEIKNHSVVSKIGGELDKTIYSEVSMPLDVSITLGTDAKEYYEQYDAVKAYIQTKRDFLIRIVIAFVITLIGLVLLTFGAGRVPTDDELHLLSMDRIYLDISLAIAVAILLLLIFLCGIMRYSLYFPSEKALTTIIYLIGGYLLVIALPWLLSFVRHIKQGEWWKHTFLYKIFHRIHSAIQSVWRKFSMIDSKIWIVIAAVLIIVGSIGIIIFPPLVILIALAVFVILCIHLYKIALLRKNVAAVEHGNLIETMGIQSGPLAPIAHSMEQVTKSVDVAVHERLKSERMKTELITNVSHDIRTPLTSLITYTDLLKNKGLDSPEAPEYLDVLIQKSARLKTLTDDLFEATKAASGNIDVHLESLDLSELIQQSYGELDEQVKKSNLNFIINTPEKAMICGDGRLLSRVLENLFSNVFKYALPNTRVYLDLVEYTEKYCLEIKNISAHPLNIPAEQLSERFIRGDESRSTEGSGLGLSIVKSFIENQNGHCDISIDGDLFKVSICLPKA